MSARLSINMATVRALHAQGFTCREIARRMGVNYGAMRWRTNRAGLRFRLKGARHGRYDACKRGHDITAPGVFDERGCVECRRIRDREYKRANPKRATQAKSPTQGTIATMRQEHDRVRRILDLYAAREHAPHWMRPALTEQIEALRA